MEIHLKLDLQSKIGADYLMTQLVEFGTSSEKWKYDERQSLDYTKNLFGSTGCFLVCEQNGKKVVYASQEYEEKLCSGY